jgi:hypothetical protein
MGPSFDHSDCRLPENIDAGSAVRTAQLHYKLEPGFVLPSEIIPDASGCDVNLDKKRINITPNFLPLPP